jgi:hypothetical protein
VLVSLLDSYRQARDLDEDLLRRHLTTLHDALGPGRAGGGYLRPLWEAYLERGRRQLQSLGTMAAAEPEFIPGWARGDLILGNTLIDIKTGWYVTDQLDYCLNQLLGYVLLDRSGVYAIDQIGIYLARYAAIITWPLSTLLPELCGQPSVDLGQIREDFAGVCRASIDEHLAWLQAKQAARQPRQPWTRDRPKAPYTASRLRNSPRSGGLRSIGPQMRKGPGLVRRAQSSWNVRGTNYGVAVICTALGDQGALQAIAAVGWPAGNRSRWPLWPASRGGGKHLAPGLPGPVEEHGRGGAQQRGAGRDDGDLPACHAACDDGVADGGSRGSRCRPTTRWSGQYVRAGEGGGCAGAKRGGDAARVALTRRIRFMMVLPCCWFGQPSLCVSRGPVRHPTFCIRCSAYGPPRPAPLT